ncbi:MAG: YraN family protein [Alphaproteobacteria bacterium]|nr:YraN family protein [Alphaproteobacteria bacterium]MBE8220107.1 YraN family protein [Alphaproteobacteria bacterium]
MFFSKKTKGYWAETLAVWVLRFKGYRIVARNVLLPIGEIDIIARKKRLLVFVEVKYRHNEAGLPAAVHPRQWQRIAAVATAYVGRRPFLHDCQWRFDEIWVSATIKPSLIFFRLLFRHHQNMWHYKSK